MPIGSFKSDGTLPAHHPPVCKPRPAPLRDGAFSFPLSHNQPSRRLPGDLLGGMNYAGRPLLRRTKQAAPARMIFAHSPFALSRVSAPIRT